MSVKIERIVLDSSMCEFERLQRFKEQIAVEFAEKDLTPYLSGEVSCTKKFPEPKLGYVLKWRQEEVTVSSLTEVAKNLFESPIKLSSPLVSDNTSSSPTLSTRKKALIDDLGDDIVIGAPDSEGVTLSPCPTVVVDEAVYYSRLESVKKESASQFKMRQYHSEKVTAGVSILKSRCTIGLHEALLEEFASRDIPAIIKAIEDLCGPGEVYSGLEKLEKSWWMLAKIPKETIAETCKRVEKLAKDIATYPGGKRYADMELLSAVDRILQVEANYESFWWQILDALRDRRASWTAVKLRLQSVSNQMQDKKTASKPDSKPNKKTDERFESFTAEQKALLTSPAVKKHIEEEKKKAVEASVKKVESKPEPPADTTTKAKKERLPYEEWVKSKKCNLCSKKGHLAKDCPDKEKNEKKENVSALVESVDDANAAEDDEEIDESHTWLCDPSASVDFAASEEVTATAFDGKSAVESVNEEEGSAESEWCGRSAGATIADDSADPRQCTSNLTLECGPSLSVSSPSEATVGVSTFVWTKPEGVKYDSSGRATHPVDSTVPRSRVSLSIATSVTTGPASPFPEASVGVSTFIWDEPAVVGDAVDSDDEEIDLTNPDPDSDDEDSDLVDADFVPGDGHCDAEDGSNDDDLADLQIPDFATWMGGWEEILGVPLGNQEEGTLAENALVSLTPTSPMINFCLAVEPIRNASTGNSCIMDSGSSSHVINSRQCLLERYVAQVEHIGLASGDPRHRVISYGRGEIGVCKNVMWAPSMAYSLASTPQFDRDGHFTIFGGGQAAVLSVACSEEVTSFLATLKEHIVMRAELRGGLYHVLKECEGGEFVCAATSVKATQPQPFTFNRNRREIVGRYGNVCPGSTGSLNPLEVLHLRSGHVSERALKYALRHNMIHGAQTTYDECENLHIRFCAACQSGRRAARPIPRGLSDHSQLKPFEVVGLDPLPLSTQTFNGCKYINFGICIATKFVFSYESQTNGDQVSVIQMVLTEYCKPYGHTLRKVFTDHHSVFLSKEVQTFLLKERVQFEASPPYEHARNMVEGAAVKPMIEKARVMLLQVGMPASMAGFAIRQAIKNANALPGSCGDPTSPYEKVTGKKPDVSVFRPFGAPVLYHISKEERGRQPDPRWTERAARGVLVGYSSICPGSYLILTPTRQILTRRNVLVLEGKPDELLPLYLNPLKEGDRITEREGSDIEATDTGGRATRLRPPTEPMITRAAARAQMDRVGEEARHAEVSAALTVQCRCCAATGECTGAEPSPCSFHPLPEAPRSIKAAEASPEAEQWREALRREREVMLDPDKPKYKQFTGTPTRFMRAVVALRVSHTEGSEVKYKARLCPDGSTQQKGIDYKESYSPTARRQLVNMLLHITATMDYEARQFDVGAAYLEVPAQSKQYMRMSDDLMRHGFSTTRFVELLANFYGTHDAGRHWFVFASQLLLEFGLQQSKEEPCLFFLFEEEEEGGKGEGLRLYVLLFVDDGLYAGNWAGKMSELEDFLRSKVTKIKFGPLKKFLGLEIERDRGRRTIHVSVHSHEQEICAKFPSTAANLRSDIPLPANLSLRGLKGEEKPIWGVTGALLFLSETTWPDLKVTVSLLSSGGANPHLNHTKGAIKALTYVNSHRGGRKLVLGGPDTIRLVGFSDASYDPGGEDSTYLYGYSLSLGMSSGAYTVVSRRSKTVSHSSLQSEMRALCEACKDIMADRSVLEEIGFPQHSPTALYTDSQGSIDLVYGYFGYYPKCRVFNRDTNYVRECVLGEHVELLKILGTDNPADLTTKVCSADETARHTRALLHGLIGTEEMEARRGDET